MTSIFPKQVYKKQFERNEPYSIHKVFDVILFKYRRKINLETLRDAS